MCPSCLDKLNKDKFEYYFSRCPICGYPLISNEYKCENCKKNLKYKIYSISDYKSSFSRDILERFKFYKDKSLSSIVAYIFSEIIEKDSLIVFVPCSNKSKKKRHWDHMEEVCKELKKKYGFSYIKLLRNNSFKQQQKELNREERIQAAKNKYTLKTSINIDKYKNKKIVVIDDVVTTGSTINSCIALLKNNGFTDVNAVTWFNEL